MKTLYLVIVLACLSVNSAFAAPTDQCTQDFAINCVENGMYESAANDCLGDGQNLHEFAPALKHFRTYITDAKKACAGKFAAEVEAYMECEAMATAKSCVTGGFTESMNCSLLLK